MSSFLPTRPSHARWRERSGATRSPARHRRLRLLTVGVLLGAAATVLPASPAFAAAGCTTVVSGATTTVTCTDTGQAVTVPAGVISAAVTLDGAGGGPSVSGVPGGKGALVTATIAVTGGSSLDVYAYPQGTSINAQADAGGTGGGPVLIASSSGVPLVMAGSGGGAGGAGTGIVPFAGTVGGDSGSAGTAGTGVVGVAAPGGAGGAGTATAGGTGGAGGTGLTESGTAGGAGSYIAYGGSPGIPYVPGGSGGSGGAGYYSGGGGGAAGVTTVVGVGFTGGSGGSGGGGSSYVGATVPGTTSSITDGVNAGDGQVVLVFVVPPPTVTAVSPVSGPTSGGNTVTITGTNLSVVTSITFGGVAATGVSCPSSTTCTATAPAGAVGTVDVQATSVGGTSPTSTADQYTYVPAPTVTAVSPASGPTAGGTVVTITGTNLTGETSVTFGGAAATAVSCTATSCTATAPAGTTGTVDVQVTTPGGTSATSSADHYTYIPPPPTVTSVSPASGPQAGGNTVTITGTNLLGATVINFSGGGGDATTFSCTTNTTCTAVVPSWGVGAIHILVTTPGGTSTATAGSVYTYLAAPTVTHVSPASGPTAGGTVVTITGTNLTGTTSVTFGAGHPATSVTCTATTCTATAPAGTTGTVDIQVTAPGGTSATSSADHYLYVPPAPTVTSVSPASGPQTGGNTVTITGTNLTGATVINFSGGGGDATTFSCTSSTTCTAVVPSWGVGAIHILVTTPGGTSAASTGSVYTYLAAPTITAISPTSGTTAGGTKVTITGTNLAGVTSIAFGTHNGTSVSCTSTSCTVTSPAETAGTVDITVTAPGGTSATSTCDRYTYH